MNTATSSGSFACLGLAAAALLLNGVSAAEDVSSKGEYHMFVGMDVEVPFDGVLHPMRRLVNRSRDAEVVVDGTPQTVSISRSETMRLKRGLKIGRSAVQVGDLEAVRSYSIGNNPFVQAARTQMAIESQANELRDNAQGAAVSASLSGINERTAHALSVAGRDAAMQKANDAMMAQMNNKPVYDYSQLSHRMGSALAEGDMHDAIEATFTLSSTEPVADVDLVLVANYTVPGKKDELRRLVYTRALGAIGPQPRDERVWVQGLPPGFELKETTVHLYSWGEELVTNLSEKSVTLSDEQAVAVMLADHLTRHRNETVPAQPIWITAPTNFRAMLDFEALPRMAQIQINHEGRVTEVFNSSGGPLPLTGLARRVLWDTRYLPALTNGEPVASTLEVELARFLQ